VTLSVPDPISVRVLCQRGAMMMMMMMMIMMICDDPADALAVTCHPRWRRTVVR
jgi:hypothetical protein